MRNGAAVDRCQGNPLPKTNVGHRKSSVAWMRPKTKAKYAGVVKLADTPDLGSGVFDVQVQILSPAPYRVFIRDFTYEYSIFCLNTVLCMSRRNTFSFAMPVTAW